MELIKSQYTVLVIYEGTGNSTEHIKSITQKAKEVTTLKVSEFVNSHVSSKYDVILSGNVPYTVKHDSALLSAILKAAKPDGNIIIRQKAEGDNNSIISLLKVSGFTKISEPNILQERLNNTGQVDVVEMRCYKPNFEVGSSIKLNLKTKASVDVSSVWKLEDTVDDDLETIDPDNLLDDDDLKKPDAPLRVCNTTGKRKACKDCSCGLAEELLSEQSPVTQPAEQVPKSSCGSCYLGDAFRCATCPYLGMPAFKPGEKIQLSNQQLQADT